MYDVCVHINKVNMEKKIMLRMQCRALDACHGIGYISNQSQSPYLVTLFPTVIRVLRLALEGNYLSNILNVSCTFRAH